MTSEEKKVNIRLARRRYAELHSKREKGEFLDQFCAMTGMHRKSAVRCLAPAGRPHRRRGRPFKTGMGARMLLARIWKLAGRPCSKLLRPVLGAWVDSLRRAGDALDEEAVAEVLAMCDRTIDRRLSTVRPHPGGGRGRSSSLSEHRRRIPLKADAWPPDAASAPGWIEIDSVAHCGGSMAGRFNYSVDMTDVATQWTEILVAWTNRGDAIAARLEEGRDRMPFPIMGVNTDNGPDYVNETLDRRFAAIFPGAARSRSRPYCKNDNAHVEQKNGHRVRRLFGFGRYGEPGETEAMGEVARLQSLYDNLYRPTQKLLRKTQDGHRWRKVFEKDPKTPAQRVLESPSVPEPCKDRVRVLLARNDPLELLRRVEAAKRRLQRVQARLAGACPSSVVPAGGGSSLRSAPSGTPPASGDDGQPCVGIAVAASARNERLAPLTTDAHASVTPNMAQPGRKPRKFG